MAKRSAETLKEFWNWLWHDDSMTSWVVSIALAFVVIKFIVYPLLGLLLGTQFPVVAVVSDSMEHRQGFDEWWMLHQDQYLQYNITRQQFTGFPLSNGFNKGDIIFLLGVDEDEIVQGDVIVFWGGKAYPIIHRAIAVHMDGTTRYFETKGDNNLGQIVNPPYLDERKVLYERPCADQKDGTCDVVLGRALFRIPLLGWVKIWAVDVARLIGGIFT